MENKSDVPSLAEALEKLEKEINTEGGIGGKEIELKRHLNM